MSSQDEQGDHEVWRGCSIVDTRFALLVSGIRNTTYQKQIADERRYMSLSECALDD